MKWIALLVALAACQVKYRGVIRPAQETDAYACTLATDRKAGDTAIAFTLSCTAKRGALAVGKISAQLFDGDHPSGEPTLPLDDLAIREGTKGERHGAFFPAVRARPFVVHVTGVIGDGGDKLLLTSPAP